MNERLRGVLDRIPQAKTKRTKEQARPKPKPKKKAKPKTERPSWYTTRSPKKHASETPISSMDIGDIAAILKGSSVILREVAKEIESPRDAKDVAWIGKRLEDASVRAYELDVADRNRQGTARRDYRKQKK